MSLQPHDKEKRSSIRWIDDGECEMIDEYEEYLRELAEEIKETELNGEFDLGEVITTWKEGGEVEVIYGPWRENQGTILTHESAPELSKEALSSWDVFLRYRDGRVEVMFGNVEKKRVLPDDDPHYFEGPTDF